MTPYLKPGIKDIDDIISEVFGIPKESLVSKGKGNFNTSDARKFAMWYRISELGETLEFSGGKYNRDHATAIHARDTFSDLMETNKPFREKAERALKMLESIKN